MSETERKTLGGQIKAAMAQQGIDRPTLRALLAERGVIVKSDKTITNMTKGHYDTDPETIRVTREILGIADQAPPTPRPTQGSLAERLTKEADDAQHAFEQAVADMEAAEAAADRANNRIFAYLAMAEKIHAEARRREAELGRALTQREFMVIDGVERPTEADIARMIATHAEMDDHVWTRYEMALVEALAPDRPARVEMGTFADLEPARKQVAKLGLEPDPVISKLYVPDITFPSDLDVRVGDAALRVTDADESAGGSEDRG